MAGLISVAITHAVIKLQTRTHANGLCSHLHVRSAEADRCSAFHRLLDVSLQTRPDITQKQKIEGMECLFCGPHGVLSSVCCWLAAGIPEILCRCVIEPATGVRFVFPSSTFPQLSAICLSSDVIPQSALNYWPRYAISWDHSFLLSATCSRDILVIAEQNENLNGFIRFTVR